MSSPVPPIAPRASPPVHQHRTWRHLQRAAVAAHPQLSIVTQANFCSLMVPAASVAVWILQHAPHLALRSNLGILVVSAIEFQALDHGRWFQFIPWLLGRPAMRVRVTLQGSALWRSLASAGDESSDAAPAEDAIERHLRTRGWSALSDLSPADIYPGTLKELTARIAEGGRRLPDLCILFAPAFAQHLDTLLTDDGLLPLIRQHVPLALFSPSETEQLIDAYALEAHGLKPRERDCWPNPWALPTKNAERSVVYGKLGWAAEFDAVPRDVVPDLMALHDLSAALDYLGSFAPDGPEGPDAFLSLGESLGTAPRESAPEGDEGSVLLRLPQSLAVDTSNGAVYQLQDVTALLLEVVPHVPATVLETFPGNEDILRRVMWVVNVHREYVSPFVDDVDQALRSQFAKLGDMSEP